MLRLRQDICDSHYTLFGVGEMTQCAERLNMQNGASAEIAVVGRDTHQFLTAHSLIT
jgi:hypothetical protein